MATKTQRSEQDQRAVKREREALLDGSYFARHAMSHRSRPLGGACVAREKWAHAIQTLGRMAVTSDAFAQLAATIGLPPLYQTDGELCAAIYERAHSVLAQPYDNVVRRSGPEQGRLSCCTRDWTLAERLQLAAWLAEATAPSAASVPTIGWVLPLIAEDAVALMPHTPSLK